MVQKLLRIVVVIVQPALERATAEVFNVGCFVTRIASVAEAKVDLFYQHASAFDVALLNPTRLLSLGGGASLFKWAGLRWIPGRRMTAAGTQGRSRKGLRFFFFSFLLGGEMKEDCSMVTWSLL